ncbi:glycosyltransferase family 2 protein [Marinigracilibium pacificum]|uniref:Glycosyltransferase family 2 protein n=1 Tax=Marinigracilibium pacificum TaxID=2729599 RepID=A0A848IZ23_9BACT|nr:glycosyltransferase family 2 protein [Marinigracilibium pacificum]NMM47249.1 glycosyltransferase family 2 protein [Marinigracilibium pacificum]
MQHLPKVSILTVNYNQEDMTREFLGYVKNLTYSNIETIVIDNGSNPSLSEKIKSDFPEVIFIISEENLGFAGGNNLGIHKATGDYLLLLNNDTILHTDFLEPLIESASKLKDLGMATPKVKFFEGENLIQYAGATGIHPITGRGRSIGHLEKDTGKYDTIYETELAHGCALLIPRKVVEDIGIMPEIFFLYYEEHDWCQKAKRKGYKIYYLGVTEVIHKESVTVGKANPLKTYYLTRNRLLFMRRNNYGWRWLFGAAFFFTISLPKNLIQKLLSLEFQHAKAIISGAIKGLLMKKTHPSDEVFVNKNNKALMNQL